MSTEPKSPADSLQLLFGWASKAPGAEEFGARICEHYDTVRKALVPATPAPESPAPAREPLCCPHGVGESVCCDCHPELRYKAPEVGTGSEDLKLARLALAEMKADLPLKDTAENHQRILAIMSKLRSHKCGECEGTGSETSPDAARLRKALEAILAKCEPHILRTHMGESERDIGRDDVADDVAEIAREALAAKPAEVPEAEHSSPSQPPGYALAMRVRQSTLYGYLDDVERGECDALVKGWASKLAQPPEPLDGARPEWTRSKPTEADYYWVRIRSGDPKGKGNTDLGIRLVVPEEWSHPLGGTWYEFNGPIPEPLAQAPTRTGG